MFEHLAAKLFRVFLSKYFTEESLARNKSSTSAQLGVWSGYISLENLELKKDVINQKLRRKGQPFEIVHCSFRRVEITVPWFVEIAVPNCPIVYVVPTNRIVFYFSFM